jgi:hypothetical protein
MDYFIFINCINNRSINLSYFYSIKVVMPEAYYKKTHIDWALKKKAKWGSRKR